MRYEKHEDTLLIWDTILLIDGIYIYILHNILHSTVLRTSMLQCIENLVLFKALLVNNYVILHEQHT